MPKVAHAEKGASLYTEGKTFDFGKDGKRQVTEAEAEALARYAANGGTLKVEVKEADKDKE